MEIPKSLASGMHRLKPERLQLFVYLLYCEWEEQERRTDRSEEPGPAITPTAALAAGTGLDPFVCSVVLREMAAEGYLEETPEGWRLIRCPEEEG